MAKVTAPLMSLTASGSIANVLTMLHTNARQVAKRKSAPTGAASPFQTARRAFYQLAAADWRALDQPTRTTYQPAADAARITLYNAYMAARLATFATGLGILWDQGAAVWDGSAAVWA